MQENIQNNKQTKEEFYPRFQEKLEAEHTFPGNYIFKFILPTDNQKIAMLQKVFDHANPVVSSKESKNGKYTSVTITIYATDSTSVIEYYKEAGEITPDIILL